MTEQELDKMIARINELAHKSKKEGLTEEEAMEQTELRGKYIANFRTNFRSQLDKFVEHVLPPTSVKCNNVQKPGI